VIKSRSALHSPHLQRKRFSGAKRNQPAPDFYILLDISGNSHAKIGETYLFTVMNIYPL
jgi:hypothetical protein